MGGRSMRNLAHYGEKTREMVYTLRICLSSAKRAKSSSRRGKYANPTGRTTLKFRCCLGATSSNLRPSRYSRRSRRNHAQPIPSRHRRRSGPCSGVRRARTPLQRREAREDAMTLEELLAAEDAEVQITGERTWAERDTAARALAVELDDA